MFKSELAGGVSGAIAGSGLFSSPSKYSLHLFSCSSSAVKCFPSLLVGDMVAQWLVHPTWDQKVESSSPGRCTHVRCS